jgi:hypothetical protein
MKGIIGKFQFRGMMKNVGAESTEINEVAQFDMTFEGCEYEITMKEVIDLMVTRFDLFVKAMKGLLTFSGLARIETVRWNDAFIKMQKSWEEE